MSLQNYFGPIFSGSAFFSCFHQVISRETVWNIVTSGPRKSFMCRVRSPSITQRIRLAILRHNVIWRNFSIIFLLKLRIQTFTSFFFLILEDSLCQVRSPPITQRIRRAILRHSVIWLNLTEFFDLFFWITIELIEKFVKTFKSRVRALSITKELGG